MKRRALAGALALALCASATLAVAAGSPAATAKQPKVAPPVVYSLPDNIVAFYFGRGLTGANPYGGWFDMDWALGGVSYAILDGDQALVYDTMMLPEQGAWVKQYLKTKLKINHFTVVLSHWHPDHIAGNPFYAPESHIISSTATRDVLVDLEDEIESGTLWGPPPTDVVLPDITFEGRMDMYIGSRKVELHRFNVHTADQTLLYLPDSKTLFSGDGLEDTTVYINEPAEVPAHLPELARLKDMDISRIYPCHGNYEVIRSGGYTETFIDATREYETNMLLRVHDADYLTLPLEAFIPSALANGAVSVWAPYRDVHSFNLNSMYEYWKDKAIPPIS
jgi:cyclase